MQREIAFTVHSSFRNFPEFAGIFYTNYMGAEKSLPRPRRKQSTETEDFDVHISYL